VTVVDLLPRDAIPPIYEPTYQPVDGYDGAADDDIVVVEVGESVRGYPVRYLTYHEVVDDELAGVPIAVTWCPLCGSVAVFDRRVDGTQLTFGVSGKLADDTLVMYDHETDSEWKQSLGRGIAGPHEGTELERLPATTTTYEQFRSSYPDAALLAPAGGASETASDTDEPAEIDYDEAAFDDYFAGDGFGLGGHREDVPQRSFPLAWIDPKTVVVGLERAGDAVGVPRPAVLDAGGAVSVAVGGEGVVVFAITDGTHAYHDPGRDWRLVDGLAVAGGSRRPARRWTTANRWNGSRPSGCSPTAGSTTTERRRSTGGSVATARGWDDSAASSSRERGAHTRCRESCASPRLSSPAAGRRLQVARRRC